MPAPSGRILIVDDEPLILEALSAALAPPCEVVRARTGSAAVELLGHQPLDLVLLDYVLPDVSGLAILRATQQVCPQVLVMLITGFGSEDIAVEAFRAGARDYLRKPIRLQDLLTRVEALLAGRQPVDEPGSAVFLGANLASPDAGPGSFGASFQRAIPFMEAHLDWHLSLEQVARQAGMSKFHFCRYFKKSTGLSFREFLVRRRVARALELLLNRKRSVSQVSLEVGFKDLGHFSRAFRKLTGQPPSRYRRLGGDRAGGGEGAGHLVRLDPGAAPAASPEAPISRSHRQKSNRSQVKSNQRQAGSKSGIKFHLGGGSIDRLPCGFSPRFGRPLAGPSPPALASSRGRFFPTSYPVAARASPAPHWSRSRIWPPSSTCAGPGDTYARRGFRLTPGQRCGDHDVCSYLAQVNALKRQFVRLAASR